MSGAKVQPRKITLEWRGPIRIPKLADSFERFRPLAVPALYFYRQLYPDLCSVYVGRTDNFQRRLLSHLEATIALGYDHRDASGKWVYSSVLDNRLAAFDSRDSNLFDAAYRHAAATEFFFAPCANEETKSVEAALIDRLQKRSGRNDEYGMNLECENGRLSNAGRYDAEIEVVNAVFQGEAAVGRAVELSFGENPIKWGGN